MELKRYKTIDEYHEAQSNTLRPKLEQLRNIIKQVAPISEETISYGMPAFKQNKILVYYAAYKNHIGFYPTPGPISHFETELKEFKTSKAAIQFPNDKPLPVAIIKKIVKFRLMEESK